ncbi:MAG: DNA methyltransferase [Patescibacteria group bacterium]|jgi:site-specific DNA-methyltransferase (cytosine-N4-specific)
MERRAIYTTADEGALVTNGKGWNFHGVDTQEHLHSLHPYPARFIPQIPRKAIEQWSKPGELVYDPFCGCGTTLLEASILGRPSIGTDNNDIAILVSRAKTLHYTKRSISRLRIFAESVENWLTAAVARPELIPSNDHVPYWFTKDIMDRLAALKGLILSEKQPEKVLLQSIFSSIIVRVSFQDSDTRYARVPRDVTVADVGSLFRLRLLDTVRRLDDAPRGPRAKVTLKLADARKVPFIRDRSVTLIVTSPPYLNAYDYHKYHRQRIHWLDGDVAFARDLEIGSHDEFTRPKATADKYFTDMENCLREWSRVLRPGGRCLFVVGDAIVNKRAVPVGDTFIKLFRNHGMPLEERWIRTLQATKRSFNVRNSRITHEHVLLFKRS